MHRTTADRGYGPDHAAERRRLTPTVNAGHAHCTQPICIKPTRWIQPGTPWALGHTDDRTAWIGPTHHACNQRDGAIKGGRARAARRHTRRTSTTATWQSRTW